MTRGDGVVAKSGGASKTVSGDGQTGQDSAAQKEAGSGILPLKPLAHLLREHGVEDWDPRVLYQLLEFQYRTTKSLLDKSKQIAFNVRLSDGLTTGDVRMALMCEEEQNPSKRRDTKTFRLNSKPLPGLSQNYGPVFPNGWLKDDALLPLIFQAPSQKSSSENGAAMEGVETYATGEGMYNVKKRKTEVSVKLDG